MSYEQELTFQLRLRGRSEDEIAETIRELRAHGVDAAALRDEFGSPAEYADGFEKRPPKSLGSTITAAGTIVAVAWIVVCIAVAAIRRFALGIEDDGDGLPSFLLPVAFGFVMVGLAGGYLIDRLRRPKSAAAD
ncbi:hypothetical protein [Microbacterium oleivorans]|uniref:Uncharacterized protein n=1 Tax=Microbacterium oleivorans TaxID=273677 RepID=A0A4R5YS05_9MICO|nr:hypothetical protein [Microbacterium oleivorans]TDL46127.1 hypothetical protein E2R54_06795 [Microbacterium oleivorans]